jgi:hypothetical protein
MERKSGFGDAGRVRGGVTLGWIAIPDGTGLSKTCP